MSSYQNAAPGGKSLKFTNALNPFEPFLAGSQKDNDSSNDNVSLPLTEQFDKRLRLDQTTATRRQPQQQPLPHQQQRPSQQQQQQQHKQPQSYSVQNGNTLQTNKPKNDSDDDTDSNDSDVDDSLLDEFDGDDDVVLQAIREKRLAELKAQARIVQQKQQNQQPLVGEVQTIAQDEFLTSCNTPNGYVIIHFFHNEFQRCHIMDYHLQKIAKLRPVGCKFVRIDATKSPFFVVKLKIQTLPTLVVFRNGQVVQRLIGFEDLIESTSKDMDNFRTCRLGYWFEKHGIMEYNGPESDDEEDDHERSTTSHRFRLNDEDD